jgi:hypothetical protein
VQCSDRRTGVNLRNGCIRIIWKRSRPHVNTSSSSLEQRLTATSSKLLAAICVSTAQLEAAYGEAGQAQSGFSNKTLAGKRYLVHQPLLKLPPATCQSVHRYEATHHYSRIQYHYIFRSLKLLYRLCTFSVRVWPAKYLCRKRSTLFSTSYRLPPPCVCDGR